MQYSRLPESERTTKVSLLIGGLFAQHGYNITRELWEAMRPVIDALFFRDAPVKDYVAMAGDRRRSFLCLSAFSRVTKVVNQHVLLNPPPEGKAAETASHASRRSLSTAGSGGKGRDKLFSCSSSQRAGVFSWRFVYLNTDMSVTEYGSCSARERLAEAVWRDASFRAAVVEPSMRSLFGF